MHSFHKVVADVISASGPEGEFFWDGACGGTQNLRLAPMPAGKRGGWLTQVDGLYIKDSKVELILEIEEEHVCGFTPNRLNGKFLSAALCSYFVPRSESPVPFSSNVSFVHVVNQRGLNANSSKTRQYEDLACK